MHKLKKLPISAWLPIVLLGLLGIFLLIWIFTQAGNYGQTMDEPLRDNYGQSVLGWYKSLGKDTSFLNYPPQEYELQHGVIFDVVTVVAERLFKHYWYTHAVVIGLSGVAGVVAIALCGYELCGLWGALLAALGLCLYPRYSGAIFNNPKDIPFAAAYCWVLWSVLLLVKRWDSKKYFRYMIIAGVLIGIAASIRVTAVIWYGILVLMLLVWWNLYALKMRYEGKFSLMICKSGYASIGLFVASLLAMMVLWPYIAIGPIPHLIESIQVMSKYPWNGTVLFAGRTYAANDIPRWYAPWWLIIGSPPVLIICFALGCFKIGLSFARNRLVDAKLVIVLLAFFMPLTVIVAMHSVLYGSLRQFLFLVPPMILIAMHGAIQVFKFLTVWRKEVAAGFALALLLSYSLVIKDIAVLYPYEYIYFSSDIIGGLPAYADSYETDYWGSCQAESAEWLAQNYHRYTTKRYPTAEGIVNFESLVTMHLPDNFRVDEVRPDFIIKALGVNRDTKHHIIHRVEREGVTLCTVETNILS